MFYDSWTNSEPLADYEHHTEEYDHIHSDKGLLEYYIICNSSGMLLKYRNIQKCISRHINIANVEQYIYRRNF